MCILNIFVHSLTSYVSCLNDDQFTMELISPESGNAPKRYSMDMSKDFIPMSAFSEAAHGKHSSHYALFHFS